MRVLVTAGPTREYIDPVRYISNASSGKMGAAVAVAAAEAGHEVRLLAGPGIDAWAAKAQAAGAIVERFVSTADLKRLVLARFVVCDALVMAAAVGDFRVEHVSEVKRSRAAGPISLRLLPTEDVLAGASASKRAGQVVVAFAVEDPPTQAAQAKAAAERVAKGADFVVVNFPAAMEAAQSEACILGPDGFVLPWALRDKDDLAAEIVRVLARA